MKDIVKYCKDTIKEIGALINFTETTLKQSMEKEEYINIEEVILQNEENTKRTVKQKKKKRKKKKFNYLKYKPANDKTLQQIVTLIQQGNPKLSYANALKQNINHKPPTNNTTDQTSERPTLQHHFYFSTKHTRRNRSRSPSREHSTTESNIDPEIAKFSKGSRNCKIESTNVKLKQINQTQIQHGSCSSKSTKNSN